MFAKNIHISDQKPSPFHPKVLPMENIWVLVVIQDQIAKNKRVDCSQKTNKKKNLERLHTSSLIYAAEWGIMGTGTKSGAWNQIFFYVLLIFRQNFVKWFFEKS